MSKAKDTYYEFKKAADLHFEGLVDPIDDYVKELEAEKAELLGILYKIRDSYCCESGFNLSDDVLNKYEGGE